MRILRRWSGRIRTDDEAAYVAYIEATGLRDYARTAGNLGSQMVLRDLGDGTTEVTTLSWWTSMDAIAAFAGESVDLARYYPGDDRYLIDRPAYVEHHRVAAYSGPSDE